MTKLSLIFVTGLLSNDRVFQHQYKHLHDIADITVVNLTDVDTPKAMVDKILINAPQRFALVGHSIGGWIAIKLMSVAPERVARLCIMNTAARGIDSAEMTARQTVLNRIQSGEFHQLAHEIAEKFTYIESAKSDVLGMFLQVGEQALINQTKAMMLRDDLINVLPMIHCPTLVIHAAEDQRFTLKQLEEVANHIPNAKLAIINNCGHMTPMEQPDKVTALLREWLLEV